MTRDILRTGQRLLDVRRVRNEPEHRSPAGQGGAPLSAPRYLLQRGADPAPPSAFASIASTTSSD